MVGSTSRLPLPSTTFGRPLYLPNRAPQTRLICVHTPEQEPATSCVDVPQHLNSGLHPWCFGRLCVRGSGAACPRSGRLKSRATAPERTLARVCREAGAMRTHVKLRDLNTIVPVLDDRSIEVLASGLPMHHGAQLAVDITLRSAVTSFGAACPSASRVNGVTLDRARLDKERKYHELLDGGRCHLVVVGLETGGRWSDEALHFIETLVVPETWFPCCVVQRSWDGVGDGSACCKSPAAAHSLLRCSPHVMTFGRALTVPRPIWLTCSGWFVEF